VDDVGLLLLGLATGSLVAAHGVRRLAGRRGAGAAGWTAEVVAQGFRPARPFALAFAWAGVLGGIGLALGAMTPLAAGAVIAVEIVEVFHIRWANGFWEADRGIEHPLLVATAALVLGLTGRGLLGMDAALSLPGALGAVGLADVGRSLAQLPVVPLRIAALLAGASVGAVLLALPRRPSDARLDAQREPEPHAAHGDRP
jgi:putative oxidoreductase